MSYFDDKCYKDYYKKEKINNYEFGKKLDVMIKSYHKEKYCYITNHINYYESKKPYLDPNSHSFDMDCKDDLKMVKKLPYHPYQMNASRKNALLQFNAVYGVLMKRKYMWCQCDFCIYFKKCILDQFNNKYNRFMGKIPPEKEVDFSLLYQTLPTPSTQSDKMQLFEKEFVEDLTRMNEEGMDDMPPLIPSDISQSSQEPCCSTASESESEEKPLPKLRHTRIQCRICFNNFSAVNVLIILDCEHFFCNMCIDSIHKTAKSNKIRCPVCREDSTQHIEDLPNFEKFE